MRAAQSGTCKGLHQGSTLALSDCTVKEPLRSESVRLLAPTACHKEVGC